MISRHAVNDQVNRPIGRSTSLRLGCGSGDSGRKPARLLLVVSRSGLWARGRRAPVPHVSRYLLTSSTVRYSKWCSLNVYHTTVVLLLCRRRGTIREAFQERGAVAGTSRSIDRRFGSFCHTSLSFSIGGRDLMIVFDPAIFRLPVLTTTLCNETAAAGNSHTRRAGVTMGLGGWGIRRRGSNRLHVANERTAVRGKMIP
jgi:hypothetical protein